MNAGIIKEQETENRVALLPETVAVLDKLNVTVMVEKGAGINAFAPDTAYQEAGALIESRDKIFAKSDLLLKVTPPDKEELSKMKEGQIVISIMNPFFNKEMIDLMLKRNITSFGMDIVPRTTRAQSMDVLSSMATVAGYKAVLDAAGRLPNFFPMFMTAAGTIRPSKVLILGAGVAGLQAVATARKLGAVVEVFDVRSAVKEQVMSLGAKFVEVEGATEDAAAG